jgi:hypothetical protein
MSNVQTYFLFIYYMSATDCFINETESELIIFFLEYAKALRIFVFKKNSFYNAHERAMGG